MAGHRPYRRCSATSVRSGERYKANSVSGESVCACALVWLEWSLRIDVPLGRYNPDWMSGQNEPPTKTVCRTNCGNTGKNYWKISLQGIDFKSKWRKG
jgi:hypothetical protein